MQKFVLMLVVLFGFTVAINAQNASAPPSKPSASASDTPASGPAQPIAFNHKLHSQTAKMTCNECHEARGDGTTLALPQAAKCMRCHASIATDNPDIKRLSESAKNEDPILWVRVYRVPSFVTFSHKTHSSNTCEECHGPVAERTVIAQEKDTNMGSCIACHQAKGAPTTCDTCHAIMSTSGRSPFDVDPRVLARLGIQSASKQTHTAPSWHVSPHASPELAVVGLFLHAPLL